MLDGLVLLYHILQFANADALTLAGLHEVERDWPRPPCKFRILMCDMEEAAQHCMSGDRAVSLLLQTICTRPSLTHSHLVFQLDQRIWTCGIEA